MAEQCCAGRWNGAGTECDESCGCAECVTWREDEDRTPVLESLKVEKGAAGQVASVGTVKYPGETAKAFSFGGNVYGGPVAYTFQSEAPGAGGWMSGFVADPDRFGVFHEDPLEWTRRYFAQS